MPAITELWDLYAQRLEASGHAAMKDDLRWQGMFFSDGTPHYDDAMRLYYRNNISHTKERLPRSVPSIYIIFMLSGRMLSDFLQKKKAFIISRATQAFFIKISTAFQTGLCAHKNLWWRTHGGDYAGPGPIL